MSTEKNTICLREGISLEERRDHHEKGKEQVLLLCRDQGCRKRGLVGASVLIDKRGKRIRQGDPLNAKKGGRVPERDCGKKRKDERLHDGPPRGENLLTSRKEKKGNSTQKKKKKEGPLHDQGKGKTADLPGPPGRPVKKTLQKKGLGKAVRA